ncbi:MAG: hypothetical protein JWP15_753, partial [Alphaproteobacteria bacterium]|nr:hypothetical protein [Alphaproteobacteria bacterium]
MGNSQRHRRRGFPRLAPLHRDRRGTRGPNQAASGGAADARPAIGARRVRRLAAALAFRLLCTTSLAQAENAGQGLLFHVSADRGFVADQASGDAVPSFQSKVSIVPDGKAGGAIR